MIYFVDFDSTICPDGDPQPECRETLQWLKKCNHTIYIYSCRSNAACVPDPERSTEEIRQFMKKHDLPYDDFVYGKPFFNHLIDDRAIGAPLTDKGVIDWKKVKELVQG